MEPRHHAIAVPPAPEEPQLLSALSRHWELDDEAKQGAFLFRPHHPNYFLPLKYSNAPNNTPFQATFTQPDLGLDPIETELQLSFKVKGMEGVFGHDNVDLWFGYTITSFWQAYNTTISSPFRETNYEPEVMLVFRTNYEIGRFSRALHQPGDGAPVERPQRRACRAAGTGSTRSSDSSATTWRC